MAPHPREGLSGATAGGRAATLQGWSLPDHRVSLSPEMSAGAVHGIMCRREPGSRQPREAEVRQPCRRGRFRQETMGNRWTRLHKYTNQFSKFLHQIPQRLQFFSRKKEIQNSWIPPSRPSGQPPDLTPQTRDWAPSFRHEHLRDGPQSLGTSGSAGGGAGEGERAGISRQLPPQGIHPAALG